MSERLYLGATLHVYGRGTAGDRIDPPLECTVYDVWWEGDGWGKHGYGPFATERQAEACRRAAFWPGTVFPLRAFIHSAREGHRIFRSKWAELRAVGDARSAAPAEGLVPYKTSLQAPSPAERKEVQDG